MSYVLFYTNYSPKNISCGHNFNQTYFYIYIFNRDMWWWILRGVLGRVLLNLFRGLRIMWYDLSLVSLSLCVWCVPHFFHLHTSSHTHTHILSILTLTPSLPKRAQESLSVVIIRLLAHTPPHPPTPFPLFTPLIPFTAFTLSYFHTLTPSNYTFPLKQIPKRAQESRSVLDTAVVCQLEHASVKVHGLVPVVIKVCFSLLLYSINFNI